MGHWKQCDEVSAKTVTYTDIELCNKTMLKQIRHKWMKTLAYKHFKIAKRNEGLWQFSENKIQKIYLNSPLTLAEVEFEFNTRFLELFDFYHGEYRQWKEDVLPKALIDVSNANYEDGDL